MKKNKLLFLTLALALIVLTLGCTAQPRNPGGTQTRIGLDSPNNNNNNDMINRNMRENDNGLLDMDNNTDERNRTMGKDTLIDNDNDLDNNNGINRRNNNNSENNTERANRIVKKVTELNEVNRASVLVNNNTAIVGINMRNNVEGELTRNLKQKVERIVKNTDNNIENVSITADPDLFTRITNMANQIGNGQPLSGFAEQFEEILRRINPIR